MFDAIFLRRTWGAFGPFAMDGSVTSRVDGGQRDEVGERAAELWQPYPVKGDVGLLFIPESELFK